MNEDKMTVLTKESIITLKGIGHAQPLTVWERGLDQLVGEYGLETLEVDVTYLRGYEFVVGATGDRKHDKQNAETLWNALPDLTPSQATDERIWATLALGDFKDYVLKRWSKSSKVSDTSLSKIFVRNTRALIRDHSISRLWWRAHFARLVQQNGIQDPMQLFFEFEDIPGEIAGRPLLSDTRVLGAYVKTIAAGLESLQNDSEVTDVTAKKYIQGVGKHLNFLAGRFQLGAVSDTRLQELMNIAHKNAIARATA